MVKSTDALDWTEEVREVCERCDRPKFHSLRTTAEEDAEEKLCDCDAERCPKCRSTDLRTGIGISSVYCICMGCDATVWSQHDPHLHDDWGADDASV